MMTFFSHNERIEEWYCPKLWKLIVLEQIVTHQEHLVTQYKSRATRDEAQGKRRYDGKQAGFVTNKTYLQKGS